MRRRREDDHPLRQAAGFRRRRRFGFGRDGKREVEEELAAHLAHAVADLTAHGLTAAAAEHEAARRLGDATSYARACVEIDRRRQRRRRWEEIMGNFVRDLQFAGRLLRRSPGFAAAAIITLALGIGANTAVFSVYYGVLLRPLPFPEPDRLFMLYETNPTRAWTHAEVAPANFLDWREAQSPFSGLTAHENGLEDLALSGAGEPRVVHLSRVDWSFFDVMGVAPIVGRKFLPQENWSADGHPHVGVVSHRAWLRFFGADPHLVGRVVRINGRPIEVIGILPAGFAYPSPDADFWVPLAWQPDQPANINFRRAHWMRVVGRLRPGATFEQARNFLNATAARLERLHPDTNTQMGAGLMPLTDWLVGDRRRPLVVLLLAVGLVLAASCVNVSLLHLARASRRAGEITVRRALGASRRRLLRQLATESLLLSALGGAAGVAIGWTGMRLLLRLGGSQLPRTESIHLDGGVLLFALLITTLGGLLASLWPALSLSRRRAAELLRAGEVAGRVSMARSMGRGLLVAAEVALAAILIVGVGLLLRSFAHLQQVPAGYSAPHVLVASISVPSARYPDDAAIRTFQQRMLAAARALPGVESAAFADAAPLVSQGWTGDYIVEGRPLGERGIEFHHRLVSPGYFETLGVPILRGRGFRESDDAGAPGVVLINGALASHQFRGQDPIGQRLQMEDKPDPKRPWLTIVGVVGNERRDGLASPPWDEIFVSTRQDPEQTLLLLARTSFADPLRLAPTVEKVLHGIDRNLPLYETRTLEQITADATRRERFLLALMGVFAAIALTLATIGIFGVVASSVAQRRQEIGLRIALGATRAEVLRVVAGQELALAAGGVAVGLLAAAVAGRLLRALLFEVSATDPLTFLTVAAFLAAVAMAATYAPAWGALRIDPSRALRSE